MKTLLIWLVRGYQIVLSPWMGQSCRFNPTCSNYAIGALKEYGALRGSWMALRRIGKCHPWHEGGEDPVPPKT